MLARVTGTREAQPPSRGRETSGAPPPPAKALRSTRGVACGSGRLGGASQPGRARRIPRGGGGASAIASRNGVAETRFPWGHLPLSPERDWAGPGNSLATVSIPRTVLASLRPALESQLLPRSLQRFVCSGWKYWVRLPARPVSEPPETLLTVVPWRAPVPACPGARPRPQVTCAPPNPAPDRSAPACRRLSAAPAHWGPGCQRSPLLPSVGC